MTVHAEPPSETVSEPPRPVWDEDPPFSLLTAIRQHPIVTILPAIILLAAGIYVGYNKHPTYSATATVNVGKSDIATQATPGYETAAQALASAYSRLVMSQHIAIPVGRALNESPAQVGAAVTSVPIPNNPTFSITATAGTAQGAVTLVHSVIKTLERYVARSATSQGGPAQLMAKYQAAQLIADQLQTTANTLAGKLSGHVLGVTPNQVIRARVASQSAALQASALSSQYLNLASTAVAPSLDVLENPTGASATNRTTNMEKYGVVGAVAGLVIGACLAAMLFSVVVTTRRRAGGAVV